MSSFKLKFLSNVPKSYLPIVLLKKFPVPNPTLSKLSDNKKSNKFLFKDVNNNLQKNKKQTGSIKINEDDDIELEDSDEDIISICYNSQATDTAEVLKSEEESSFINYDYDCPSTQRDVAPAEPEAESSTTCLVNAKLNIPPNYSPLVQLDRISSKNAVDSSALAVRSKHKEPEAASLDSNLQNDNDENQVLSTYCNTSFDSTDKHIENNYGTYRGRKVKKCPHCPYMSSSHLKRHIMQHTRNFPFKCTFCNYASASKANLQRHFRVHTGERLHKCDLCKFTSITLENLRIHTRSHTGERPYKCSYCEFSCSSNSNLQRHTLIHTRERLYKCSHCEFSCATPATLQQHTKIHFQLPYKCSYCPYSSANAYNLQRHIKIHTGDRPHKCSQCNYTTAFSGNLVRHLRSHAGDRRYKCPKCPRAFTAADTLKKHSAVHSVDGARKCLNQQMFIISSNANPSENKAMQSTNPEKSHASVADTHNQTQKTKATRPSTIINKPIKGIDDKSQPYVCYDCNKSFKEKKLLENHWKCHHYTHFQKVENYKCPKCEKISTSYGSFIRHFKFAHRAESSKD
ncbi:zinc finger protein 431 [Microplitis demolitor]|uniref:zinc finger protein 431 n=1 Tax=Microplitis demolitor TaxID=69319 RepID=UPI0006D4D880|nr:zinc finger protein 431 [Microplitis demolitor]